MKKCICFAFILALCCAAQGAVQNLSLKECEAAALQNSPLVASLESAAQAAEHAFNAAGASMLPVLNLEAGGSYVTDVPKISLGAAELEFGDNWGYSAGPVLYYTIFDYGARSSVKKSAKSVFQAKSNDLAWGKKSVLLQVRLAYFRVQQDLENMYLLTRQLEVAQKQLRDVKAAYNAGAKSELDVYMADKQELFTLSQISALRAATAADLRALFALTLNDFDINPAYPLDYRAANAAGLQEPSSVIKTDGVDTALNYLGVYNYFVFDEQSPQLLSAQNMADYYKQTADSYAAALWPKLSLKAGAYWEYPDGPLKQDVFLGRGALGFVMPLFEGSRTRSQAAAERAQASAAEAQKAALYHDLQKSFYSAKDRLSSIQIERALAEKIVKDAQKTYTLTYSAYKAGAVTFLEVDSANFKMTEAEISLVGLKIENLARLAVMASLGK